MAFLDSCLFYREITGKDPEPSNDSDNPDSMSPLQHNPVSAKKSKLKENGSKLMELKQRLLGAKEANSDYKKTTEKDKATLKNNWTSESIDEANTEDFNAIVTEQCRELLHKEGISTSPKENNPKRKRISKKFQSESDSDEEDRPESLNLSHYNESDSANQVTQTSLVSKTQTLHDPGDEKENNWPNKNRAAFFSSKRSYLDDDSDEDADTRNQMRVPKLTNPLLEGSDEEEASVTRSLDKTEPKVRPELSSANLKRSRLIDSDSDSEPTSGEFSTNLNKVPKLSDPVADGELEQSKHKKTMSSRKSIESENAISGRVNHISPNLTNPLSSDDENYASSMSSVKRSRLTDSEPEDGSGTLRKPRKKKIIIESDDE